VTKPSWTHLRTEKRVGEYEELTLQMGHWWIENDTQWPQELRDGYHLSSETGVDMVEPTRLIIKDPLAYRDRNKLTYRSYILRQDNEEKKLDAIIDGAKARSGFARASSPSAVLKKYIPALRHFFWGSGMMQIYGSAYTPSSTVMNTLLFQVFDSMRHAQRMVELSWELNEQSLHPVDSRDIWLNWRPVQGMRKFIEIGMATFDWAETFVALNFVFDPIFHSVHDIIMIDIPEATGDWPVAQFWLRLAEDIKGHIATGNDLVGAMIKDSVSNRAVIQDWVDKWYPLAVDAIDGLRPILEEGLRDDYREIRLATLQRFSKSLASHGLVLPVTQGELSEPAVGIPG
jgi:toluene monooxygenase system protein E